MTTRIRTALTTVLARRTARHLASVSFCDGCGQVCDASCRASAHQRRTQFALSSAR
ncbi:MULTISPECIES: hypothetical protein [Streptomyces]|uniref:hypothetical protein n=1 Tax=Streptomyces TaxID=1883 RepID=UPI001679E441|nr:hypothetical protein [Streptomyces galilaeus]GGW80960.1 hypothetical protein GCM10010350_77270 [Streptomyces galilaeus]